jgi:uncharacterized protein with HEPN domain
MSKSDDFYLEHILDQIKYITETVKNINEIEFSQNRTYQNSFCRSLEIIGEAAKSISPEFQKRYSNVPWNYMAKTRDRIIHHYFDVDYATVWDIITKDIPELKLQIQRILGH